MTTENVALTVTITDGALASNQITALAKLEQMRVLLAALPTTAGGGTSNTTEATQLLVYGQLQTLATEITALQAALPASPETGLAKDATLAAQSAKIPALVSGRTPVEARPLADQTVSGPLAAPNAALILAVRPGDQRMRADLSGTFVATAILQYSMDSRATWKTPKMVDGDTGAAVSFIQNAPGAIAAVIPTGATDVQVILFGWTSGSATTIFGTSAQPRTIDQTAVATEATLATQSAKLPPALAATGRLLTDAGWVTRAATGSLLNANDTVLVDCTGMSSVGFSLTSPVGTITGVLLAQCFLNGAWVSTIVWPSNSTPAVLATSFSPPASGSGASYRAAIVPGATQFQVIAFTGTTTAIATKITASASPDTLVMVGNAVALAAGSAAIGTVGVTSVPTPTPFSLSSAASTNLTSVKASAGSLYTVAASNNGAAAAFLKLYNKASAPVVASDVPVLIVPIGASSVVSLNLGGLGHRFATGIALAITNLIADTDATPVVAGQVKAILDYV
jgi:hypothetical protein